METSTPGELATTGSSRGVLNHHVNEDTASKSAMIAVAG